MDERGDLKLKETAVYSPPPNNSPNEEDIYNQTSPHLPPLPSFPTDRLPPLEVNVVRRLPGVAEPPTGGPGTSANHNIDPSLPRAVVPEKTLFNLWEKTGTTTEVKWSIPENIDNFHGMLYEIGLRINKGEWIELTENRQPKYRVYYVDGVAIFGRRRMTQNDSVQVARLRIRPVGEINEKGKVHKMVGPWSEDILLSMEAKGDDVND